MTREEVSARLKPIEADLRRSGFAALYLFGSTARGDATPRSDVDLAYELAPDPTLGMIGFFRLKDMIAERLGTDVDLVFLGALRNRFPADLIKLF